MEELKTIRHHSHLNDQELKDIYDTIEFCRTQSMRRVSVLGWSQINCPASYTEWQTTSNKRKDLLTWFKSLGYVRTDVWDTSPDMLKRLFNNRNFDLVEKGSKFVENNRKQRP